MRQQPAQGKADDRYIFAAARFAVGPTATIHNPEKRGNAPLIPSSSRKAEDEGVSAAPPAGLASDFRAKFPALQLARRLL